mmetsp:Transcript_118490/g.335114  ORF Transcript_118490/g.335114 Transcript_118490/m.335114 type:complete len:406 (+) Transcript_118490:1790-3007(+)
MVWMGLCVLLRPPLCEIDTVGGRGDCVGASDGQAPPLNVHLHNFTWRLQLNHQPSCAALGEPNCVTPTISLTVSDGRCHVLELARPNRRSARNLLGPTRLLRARQDPVRLRHRSCPDNAHMAHTYRLSQVDINKPGVLLSPPNRMSTIDQVVRMILVRIVRGVHCLALRYNRSLTAKPALAQHFERSSYPRIAIAIMTPRGGLMYLLHASFPNSHIERAIEGGQSKDIAAMLRGGQLRCRAEALTSTVVDEIRLGLLHDRDIPDHITFAVVARGPPRDVVAQIPVPRAFLIYQRAVPGLPDDHARQSKGLGHGRGEEGNRTTNTTNFMVFLQCDMAAMSIIPLFVINVCAIVLHLVLHHAVGYTHRRSVAELIPRLLHFDTMLVCPFKLIVALLANKEITHLPGA